MFRRVRALALPARPGSWGRSRRGLSRPPPTLERRLCRRNPALGGGLGGGRRGLLRLSSAGFAGATDSWGEVSEGGRSPPPSFEARAAMRLRTVVRGLLILAVLVWLGYAVAGIGWSYWVTQEVVDKTLRDGTARYRRTTASGGPTEGLASYLRASIAMAARH